MIRCPLPLALFLLWLPSVTIAQQPTAPAPAPAHATTPTNASPAPAAEPRSTLEPGDEVALQPIAQADWIQGNAPARWEPGKLYMIECWATWCGPCIKMIPHVNQLHQKYAEQGLRVIGMNVWEDDKAKVARFVESKGNGMSYPVAFAGRNGPFVRQWLKAAGVRGIPHAFLVKDGRLLLRTHPARIDDRVVTALLRGGPDQQEILERFGVQDRQHSQTQTAMRAFDKASKDHDPRAMADAIKNLEAISPRSPGLPEMRLRLAMALNDWDRAIQLTTALHGTPNAQPTFYALARRALAPEKTDAPPTPDPDNRSFPQPFRKAIAEGLGKTLENQPADARVRVVLAALLWDLGDKDAARSAARLAVEHPGTLPVQPLQDYARSLESGDPQTPEQVLAAIAQALRDQAAAQNPAPAQGG